MLHPRARTVRLVAVLLIAAVGATSYSQPETASAAPDDYIVTYPSWGVTHLSGPFSMSVRIPGAPLVAVDLVSSDDTSRSRIGIVDTDTYTVTEGPLLDDRISMMVVSTDGGLLYVSSSRAGDGKAAVIERYALPSMSFDRRFTVDLRAEPFNPYGSLDAMVPVPGRPSQVAVFSSDSLAIYDDGVLIGDPAYGRPFSDAGLIMSDATNGFISQGSIVDRFTITATGPVIDPDVITNNGQQSVVQVFGDRLIFKSTSYPLPSLTPARPATPVELGFADPEYNVSFVRSSNSAGAGGIYDLETGDPIVADQSAVIQTYLGDGRTASIGIGLTVTNLFDTLGSYGEFHPVTPDRLFDTRSGLGRDGDTSTLGPQSTTRIKIHGVGGVPEYGVEAVVLNITAVDLDGAPSSHLKAWPAGYAPPEVSIVNFQTGTRTGNMVSVATSADGYIDLYQHAGNAHVTVDVMGWFGTWWSDPGSRYAPYRPFGGGNPNLPPDKVRIIDTRRGNEWTGHDKLGTQDTIDVQMPYLGGSQNGTTAFSDVDAVILNVAALDPTSRSHIKIFAGGESLPEASSMNFPAAQNTARLITAPVSPDGTIQIYNHTGSTDIIVDFVGFYTRHEYGQEGRFVGIEPERVIDTRLASPFPGDGRMTAQTTIAQGGYQQSIYLAANLTIADSTSRGYITAGFAQDDPIGIRLIPGSSSLNYEAGRNVANHAIIPTGGGGIEVYHHAGQSHLIVDIFGYYTAYRG